MPEGIVIPEGIPEGTPEGIATPEGGVTAGGIADTDGTPDGGTSAPPSGVTGSPADCVGSRKDLAPVLAISGLASSPAGGWLGPDNAHTRSKTTVTTPAIARPRRRQYRAESESSMGKR
jgi:hypothetical protein